MEMTCESCLYPYQGTASRACGDVGDGADHGAEARRLVGQAQARVEDPSSNALARSNRVQSREGFRTFCDVIDLRGASRDG